MNHQIENIITQLQAAKGREEAFKIIESLKVSDLKAILQRLDIPSTGTKAQLFKKVIENTVGYRLTSAVIQNKQIEISCTQVDKLEGEHPTHVIKTINDLYQAATEENIDRLFLDIKASFMATLAAEKRTDAGNNTKLKVTQITWKDDWSEEAKATQTKNANLRTNLDEVLERYGFLTADQMGGEDYWAKEILEQLKTI